MSYNFEKVIGTEHQITKLYDLLSKRNHTISHQVMPEFEEHCLFVKNHPYRDWFLVKNDKEYLGSFYLTEQNTIGINIYDEIIDELLPIILNEIKSNFIPLPAVRSVRNGVFAVNVSPSNQNLVKAMEKFGYTPVQISYMIT